MSSFSLFADGVRVPAIPLGEMYAYEATISLDSNEDVYHVIYGLIEKNSKGFDFSTGGIAGTSVSVEADATQLQVTTSSAHGLATGDVVGLHDMNNAAHNGITLVTVVDVTNFTCDDIAYVAGAGASTGVATKPSRLIARSGTNGKFLCSFGATGTPAQAAKVFKAEVFVNSDEQDAIAFLFTPSSNVPQSGSSSGVIDIVAGDIIFAAFKNTTDDTSFELTHCNLTLFQVG